MTGFTIGEAWSQAMDFLNRNLQMLIILVGGAVVASAIVQLLLIGGDYEAMMAQINQAAASGNFAALEDIAGGGIVAAGLLGLVVQTATQQAALRLGLGHPDSMADALLYGLKSAVTILLLVFALGIVVGLAVVAVGFVFAGGAAAAGSGAGSVGLVILLFLALALLMLWLYVRTSLMGVTMADAGSINPVYGIVQSWRLTAPHQWSILVFVVVLFVAALVIGLLFQSLFGLFGLTIGALLSAALVEAPLNIVALAVFAGIYLALIPTRGGEVFS